ncbi:MAG: porphobilinogen synthase [Candidatus Omnitrophica bacterium]|nr:porphobilinogen synthase [Candidatus Omnitrophota bacterium]
MSNKSGSINLEDLIYPLFVRVGKGVREEISSMPGVYKMSPDVLLEEIDDLVDLGIKKVLLFGVPNEKDRDGSASFGKDNIVSRAVQLIKKNISEITVMTDVCLCAYTTHGHCGIIKEKEKEYSIDIDKTLKTLSRIAVSHAEAGADYVAPSAMAEGQVKAIREALDKRGFAETKIMGYSAKFESNAYGPFRDVADSAPRIGEGRPYQLDYKDAAKAIGRINQDINEKADIVMVKPALWYLDIVKEAKDRFDFPLAVYNVSGEYSFVKQGARSNFWKEKEMVFEVLHSLKRAGADLIITYHAKDVAKWLE